MSDWQLLLLYSLLTSMTGMMLPGEEEVTKSERNTAITLEVR